MSYNEIAILVRETEQKLLKDLKERIEVWIRENTFMIYGIERLSPYELIGFIQDLEVVKK